MTWQNALLWSSYVVTCSVCGCTHVWVRAHVCGRRFTTVYPLRVQACARPGSAAQAGTLAGRRRRPLNHRCLLFVRLLTVLRPCAAAHIVAPGLCAFSGLLKRDY